MYSGFLLFIYKHFNFFANNIKDGKLIITGPSGIVINNLSAVLGHVAGTSSTYKISCGGRIGYKGEQSEFNTESTIDVNPDDVLKSVFSASIKTVNWEDL